jgi:hypothetical protein
VVEVVVGHVGDRGVDGSCRVADEGVEAAEVVLGRLEQASQLRRIGHVRLNGDGPPAPGLDVGEGLAGRLGCGPVVDDDVEASAASLPAMARPIPRGAAGDETRWA